MANIDLPRLKRILWERMRRDLRTIVPWFTDYDLLLCPICCRPLGFDDFSVEHIIPQQAIAHDPIRARAAISRTQRSGMTLLCRKQLIIKGRPVNGNGCNGWKGKHFDPFLRKTFVEGFAGPITQRHQIALMAAGYLAAVREYGYQIALLPSGLTMRTQFFAPDSFRNEMPIMCQIALGGAPITDYSDENDLYWSDPFKFTFRDDKLLVGVRNVALFLPMSRDPALPYATILPYAPQKFRLRPDLKSAFD